MKIKLLVGPDSRIVDFGDVEEIEGGGFAGPAVLVPAEIAEGFLLVDAPEDFEPWAHGSSYTDGEVVKHASPEELENLKRALTENIDGKVAEVYARWLRFEAEYVARETAAREFAAAGYEGECSGWVSSFALPAGVSLQVAADRIISQADMLRGALEELGALRMLKYRILTATDSVVAQAAYDDILAQVGAIAAGLQ